MNIDRFRVRDLINFKVPIKGITGVFNEWPHVVSIVPLSVQFSGDDVGAITGEIESLPHNGVVSYLKVTDIYVRGANSGDAYESFLAMLRASSGRLVATLIWDSDMVTKITVENGVVTEDVIDE